MKEDKRETALIQKYAAEAKRAGVPADQLLNFIRAGIVLTPRQLQFASEARAADCKGGPTEIGYGGARGGGKQVKCGEIMLAWRQRGSKIQSMITRADALIVGDYLIGSDGRPVKILSKSSPEFRQFYKITFDDGVSIEVSDNHLWTVFDLQRRGPGQKERGIFKCDVETEWLAKQNLQYRAQRRFAIPLMSGAVEPLKPTKPLLPPYTLGYWLGNGCKQASTLTCHTDDVEEIKCIVEKETGQKFESKIYDEDALRAKILINGWNQRLQSVGWPFEWNQTPIRRYRTFLKDRCFIEWRNWSAEDRASLLSGLLDSDGTVVGRGDVEFDSSDLSLACLVRALLQSLGQKPTLPNSKKPKFDHWSTMYRVTCSTTRQVFKLKRKADRVITDRELKQSRRYIVSVEKSSIEEGVCFAVDASDHLYVAGESYVVTHNSHALLAQMGADDCQRHQNLKCLLLRKVGRANIENLQDLRVRLFSRIPHTFSGSKGIISFANGSKIIAGHFQNDKDIDGYLGLEYDVIGVEEATTLSSRKYKDIQTCCRTSKPDWRPRMYSNTNPGGIGHVWYRAKFIVPMRRGVSADTRFISANVTDNPYNNSDYVRILDNLTGWQKRAWRHGDWDIAAGQYFTTFRLDIHQIDHFDPLKAREWFCAMDYGFTHYTVVLLGCTDHDGNTFIVDEHAERGKLPEWHAARVHEMLERHKLNVRSLVRFSCGEDLFAKESTGKTIASQYEDQCISMTAAVTDRVNGWSEMLKLFGDADVTPPIPARLFIHTRCRRLLECIPSLQHDPHKPEDVLKVDVDEDGNGGDDAGDCARYLLATKSRGITARKLTGF